MSQNTPEGITAADRKNLTWEKNPNIGGKNLTSGKKPLHREKILTWRASENFPRCKEKNIPDVQTSEKKH